MFIEYCILFTIFVASSIFLLRNIEFAIALLLSSLILNIELPFSLMGGAVNIQRLMTIWIMVLYFLHVLLIKGDLPKITALQARISTSLLIIILVDIFHSLNGNGGVAFQLAMNLILFNLVVFMFRSLDYKQYHKLLFVLIPLGVMGVCFYFIHDFKFGGISSHSANTFYTGYRLRSGDARNIINVWAGGLSLLTPILLIPLLSLYSRMKEVVFAIISLMLLLAVISATFSRSAILVVVFACVIVGGLWALFKKKQDRSHSPSRLVMKTQNWLIVIMILGVAISMANGFVENIERLWSARMEATQGGKDASLQWRIEVLARSLSLFSEAPLLGQGQLARDALGDAFENTYAYVLAHWGGVGLISFVSILWRAGRSAFISLRKQGDIYSIVGLTLILGYAILGMTNEYLSFPVGMFSLAFVVTLNGRYEGLGASINLNRPKKINTRFFPHDI